VPLSPLIDVVFILLIFVLMVARFSEDEELSVRPPVSTASKPLDRTDDTLVVVLEADGTLRIRGEAVPLERLDAVLTAARATHPALVVRGDAAVPLQGAVDVLGAAAAAGFDQVGVVTRPPDGGPGE
jgi:biopolymer transport protein ExbD